MHCDTPFLSSVLSVPRSIVVGSWREFHPHADSTDIERVTAALTPPQTMFQGAVEVCTFRLQTEESRHGSVIAPRKVENSFVLKAAHHLLKSSARAPELLEKDAMWMEIVVDDTTMHS
jgi:NifB/MoaA-like Fe-S oxidoreductase